MKLAGKKQIFGPVVCPFSRKWERSEDGKSWVHAMDILSKVSPATAAKILFLLPSRHLLKVNKVCVNFPQQSMTY